MKKYYIFIFFILIVFFLNAESLKDAESLFTQAQSLYNNNNYKEAIKTFNKALSLYEKIQPENNFKKAYINILLGASYFKLNELDNSIKYYEESISILKKNNDKKNLLNAINAISNTYLVQKNYEKIIEYYKLAVLIYDEMNKPDKKVIYLSYIGNYYYNLKKNEESVEYYLKAIDIYKQIKNDREIFNNLNNIGRVYFYSNDKSKAVEYYEKAYEIGKKFLSKKEILPYINNIATISQEVKNYDKAVKYFLIISEINRTNKNRNDLYIVYNNIGINYDLSRKKDLALNYYKLAYETGKNFVDEKSLIDTLNKITSTAYDIEDYKTCNENYFKLVEIYVKNKSLKELADTYNSIGVVYYNIKNYDIALSYITKAEKIALGIKNEDQIADINFNYGNIYYSIKKYNDSITYLKKFFESNTKSKKESNIINTLSIIGSCYYYLNDFDNSNKYYAQAEKLANDYAEEECLLIIYENYAELFNKMWDHGKVMEYYDKALILSDKLNKKDRYAIILNNFGALYADMEDYNKAIEYYTKAMEINTAISRDQEAAKQNGNIGQVYYLMSEFDKALIYIQKSLKYFEQSDDKELYAYSLNNTGELYRMWGKYDKALEYYNNALKIAQKLNSKNLYATLYNNFGMLYKTLEEYDKAFDYFNKALVINKEELNKDLIAINLSNIGETYRLIGLYKDDIKFLYDAEKYFNEALKIDIELGNKSKIAKRLNGIALLNTGVKNYTKSIEYLNIALKYADASNKVDISNYYHNLGYNFIFLKQYKKAEDYLKKSIEIKEELRLTAKGSTRMDYLASQISSYQLLIFVYTLTNKPTKALEAAEFSRAKYLAERVSKKLLKELKYPSADKIIKYIDKDTIVISFSNVNKTLFPIRLILTTGKAIIKELDKNIPELNEKEIGDIEIINQKSRGIRKIKRDKNEEKVIDNNNIAFYDNLSNLIYYYRSLLSNPDINFKENNKANKISRVLYDYLLGDLKDLIKNKKKIIIIPDNILGLLPFETLIDENGSYLIENHDIKYTQSFTILNMIKERKYNDINKLPIIAFGGAVYDDKSYKAEISLNEKEYDKLIKDSIALLERGGKKTDIYDILKNSNWQNLPGTLMEIKSINNIFKNGEFYTGDKVNEENIKNLSKAGILKKYKMIHFATHGLVTPDYPELSALVLSISKKINDKEDGYLQAGEIADLDLNVDFVNLSACETGLGKIYGGEGIVGLPQAFILAGANNISVSLWEVADKSTMIFMTEFYKLINEKKISYSEAASQVKRMFIKDKKFFNPFFWAPFVLYGK